MLEIISECHKNKKPQQQEDTEVRVTEKVWDWLKSHDHVISGKVEKGATFLRIGRKLPTRKRRSVEKLTIDLATGDISKRTAAH